MNRRAFLKLIPVGIAALLFPRNKAVSQYVEPTPTVAPIEDINKIYLPLIENIGVDTVQAYISGFSFPVEFMMTL